MESDFDFNELDVFELDSNDFEVAEFLMDEAVNTRYLRPPKSRERNDRNLKYSDAKKLALDIGEIKKDERLFIVVNGSFIFGDFIEAYLAENHLKVKVLTISTLSMSMNNVDSLFNLLKWGVVENLNLIVSDYFFSHERHMLVKYIYEKLDIEDRFQLSACRTHTKIALAETTDGMKFVFHGSANLRSSGNIEQLVLEENSDLYDFNMEFHENIIETFKTIDKPLNSKTTWLQVQVDQVERQD